MLRPAGRRRRRRSSALRRALRWLPLVILLAAVAGLVVGSLAEVGARSGPYRRATDRSFSALANPLVQASNQTGAALARVVANAPNQPNAPVPFTARAGIQQGLDDAVARAQSEASQAERIASPAPSDDVGARFAGVMRERADATLRLRTVIDRLLGMAPLSVAGSPAVAPSEPAGPPLSTAAASTAMAAVGASLEGADAAYRALRADIRRNGYPIHLPGSVWVSGPASVAPLGSVQLAATAPALVASAALVPFHQLVLTAAGLEPPAVPPSRSAPDAAPGTTGTSCSAAQSTAPTSAAVLPPTPTVTVKASVTNCGTVTEPGASVRAQLVLSDPPGVAAPSAGAGGGSRTSFVTLPAGRSVAVSFGPVPVAAGHRYLLTLTVALPAGEQSGLGGGSTQQFLLQITG